MALTSWSRKSGPMSRSKLGASCATGAIYNSSMALAQELGAITTVLDGAGAAYLNDSTEVRGLHGRADAVVVPEKAEEVAAVLAWCYEHDVPIVARGGGTGYAGGAVPDGGVVLALERLNRVRAFDPLLWRMQLEARRTNRPVRR